MNLSRFGRIARRNALLLAALVVAAVAVGLVASLVQTPKYRATSIVYVSTQQATNLNDLAQGVDFSQEIVHSYATIVPTPLVLSPVIKSLRLDTTPQALADEIAVQVPLQTVVLQIQVTDRSPVNAARIANAVATSLSSAVPTLTPPTADSVQPVRVTLAQPATPPTSPFVPNTLLNIGIAVVVALALAVFVAVLGDALRRRAAEADDVRPPGPLRSGS